MNFLRCIIIDGDELDLLLTINFLKKYPRFKVIHTFSNAESALRHHDFNDIDVLFLDIDLPNKGEIEFFKAVAVVPACVFITAYPEHAVESFEINTVDYLIKPFNRERFQHMVDKLEHFMHLHEKAKLYENFVGGDYVFIKEGHRETKVNLHEVFYVEGLKDYSLIVTQNKRHCVLSSIGNLLKEPAFAKFIRIHRSYAVKRDVIKSKTSQKVILQNDMILPVGKSYRENLKTF